MEVFKIQAFGRRDILEKGKWELQCLELQRLTLVCALESLAGIFNLSFQSLSLVLSLKLCKLCGHKSPSSTHFIEALLICTARLSAILKDTSNLWLRLVGG